MCNRYLCWSDYPILDGMEVFEVNDTPIRDNHYDMAAVYCPICGDSDNLVFRNYETKLLYSFEGHHSLCKECKGVYDVHEVIHNE